MNMQGYRSDAVRQPRQVEQLVVGRSASDGAGVKLTWVLDQPMQARLDPFLMLDTFSSDSAQDYISGFPDHPHRGFETLTYLLAGRMRHRDNAGHQGLLECGDIQWMTAGRGIIHAEMPEQKDGRLEGFQLWINLPAKDKMQAPSYRDIKSGEIPEFFSEDGVKVRVIVGISHGVRGAIHKPITEPMFLDVNMPEGSRFNQSLPAEHNAFFYVYRGEVEASGQKVSVQCMAILANEKDADGVILLANQASRVILIAGNPLNEPIVQHGPFVMNTQEQILQAIDDYNSGRFTVTP